MRCRRSSRPRTPKISLTVKSWSAYFGQGGVQPILELCTLSDEHHPRPGPVALVPQFTRRDPDRGQRPISLQPVEPTDVEPIGLVDLSHHQLCLACVHELRGTQPAASISSTIQYQFPIVSTATGDPRSHRSRNSRNEPRSCSIRSSRTSWPSGLTTDASV